MALTGSKREERKERLRLQILESASRLFAERGYETVTLRAIADDIGYSHAVLYQYFSDKSHILAEICRETFALLLQDFDRIAQQASNPRERLFETSRGLMRFCLAHPQHCRTVFFGPEDRNGVRAGEFIGEVGKPLFDRFEEVFRSCVKSGDIVTKKPLLLAHAWWCSLLGLAMILIVQGGLPDFSDRSEVAEQAIHMMWNGIDHAKAKTAVDATSGKRLRRRSG